MLCFITVCVRTQTYGLFQALPRFGVFVPAIEALVWKTLRGSRLTRETVRRPWWGRRWVALDSSFLSGDCLQIIRGWSLSEADCLSAHRLARVREMDCRIFQISSYLAFR